MGSKDKYGRTAVKGSVILWDTFGELVHAYKYADAAFLGGSLAPLGGQNFLEALNCGVIPVTGPFWDNFSWVGSEIVNEGLLRVAEDWRGVSDALVEIMENPSLPRKGHIRSRKIHEDPAGRCGLHVQNY